MQNLIFSLPKIHHTISKDEIGSSTNTTLTESARTLGWQAGAFNIYKNIVLLISNDSSKGARKTIEPMQYDEPNIENICPLINETPYQLFIRCQNYLKNRALNLEIANNKQYSPQETSEHLVLLFKNQEDCWLIDAAQTEQLWAENCKTHIVVGFNFHERHEQKIVLPLSDWIIIEKLMRNILFFRERTHQRWEVYARCPLFICLQQSQNDLTTHKLIPLTPSIYATSATNPNAGTSATNPNAGTSATNPSAIKPTAVPPSTST